ncbi:MAG: anti-sigma factor [Acidimicrobiia bacterium]|nr:anti-sigma factor [Acidimicrobiia bacterium]
MNKSENTPEKAGEFEVSRIERVLDDETTWATPPPHVAEDLLAAIRSERERASAKHPIWLRRFWPRVSVALAAAAIIALVAGILLSSQGVTDRVPLAGTELEPGASGTAAFTATGSGWAIRLDLTDLPAAESGYYYEGWVWNDEGEGVSIGTFHLRGGSDPVQLWAGVDVDAYPWIWITLQEEGAGPAASDQIVMLGLREP